MFVPPGAEAKTRVPEQAVDLGRGARKYQRERGGTEREEARNQQRVCYQPVTIEGSCIPVFLQTGLGTSEN